MPALLAVGELPDSDRDENALASGLVDDAHEHPNCFTCSIRVYYL